MAWTAWVAATAQPAQAPLLPPAPAIASASDVTPQAVSSLRWSQLTEPTFQHLRLEDGLPHDIVRAISQDGDGFMWMGTPVGVARWDGYRFRTFKPDPKRPGSVPDSYIQALHCDAAGRIWVGTASSGLMRYDRDQDRFVAYVAGEAGISHNSVSAIENDGSGGLWIGTDSGLDHLDGATGRITRRVPLSEAARSSAGLRVGSLLRDREGTLWASTQIGLFRREARAASFTPVPLGMSEQGPIVPTKLMQDGKGRIWIGSLNHGLYLIEHEGQAPQPVFESPSRTSGATLEAVAVNAIIETRPGEIWVATKGLGIVSVDVATRQTRRIRNIPTLPTSLPENTVFTLFRDRAGLIWATTSYGASRHDPRQSAVLSMFGKPVPDPRTAGDGVPPELPVPAGTKISWILPMSPQRIWLASLEGEVYIIDPSGARVGILRPDDSKPLTALPRDAIFALEKGPDGSVFIATRRGLYQASADGSHVTRVNLSARNPAAATWALVADGNTLWLGGEFDGVWKLDLRTGQAEPSPREPARQLTDPRVRALGKGPGGTVWIGTISGLNRYDPRSGTVVRIPAAPTTPGGLSSAYISTLFTDRTGRLWIGTYGGGFNLLEPDSPPEAPRFRHLSTANGLHDDYINAVLEDRQGRIWFSTDSGLATVDPQTGVSRALRRADGVAFGTYWTGSAARTSEGELLFGGAGGMSILRPEALEAWSYRPRTLVTELRIGGRVVQAERFFGPTATTANVEPLVVDPDSNSLSVEFASTDYSAPDRNRYAYRLEGFDNDWIDTSPMRRLASYTSLPPGHYRLLLRSSNREGVWSDNVVAMPLYVWPAWYETAWFRAAAVLAALLAVAGLVQARTHFLRLQRQQLERMVDERTLELQDMSRALQEKSRVLELTSISDPLTGLRNRRFLTQHIDTEISASLRRALDFAGGSLAHPVDTDNVFLVIDIDHFKRVNDAYGHAAGDAVLVQFAQRLQTLMRETDYVVRWGGEEFLAVARNTDRGRAEELAERIRSVVTDTPFVIDGDRQLSMSCSIGFACLPFIEQDPRALGWQDIIKLADVALLAAKRAGRNGWVGLVADAGARAEGLMHRVQTDSQAAVARGEIRLSSNRAHDVVTQALAPPEPAPLVD